MTGLWSLWTLALAGTLVPPSSAATSVPDVRVGVGAPERESGLGPEGPELERASVPVGSLSRGGEDRGVFELGLGSVVMAVGVGLVVAGSIELSRAVERRRGCSSIQTADGNCELDPPGLIYASSVLSYTFAVPAFVGASLLIHRGAKIHRDYRAVRKAQMSFSLTPLMRRRRSVRGAMLGMRLGF